MGVALGYAIGVIVASAAVNIAVGIGLPTALFSGDGRGGPGAGAALRGAQWGRRPRWSARRLSCRDLSAGGGDSGDDANEWRATAVVDHTGRPRLADARPDDGDAHDVRRLCCPRRWIGGRRPVFASDVVTVTEPGSTQPISSKLPAVYADAIRDRGIDASAEILLFKTVDGQPFTARGAVFDPLANVSDAPLVEGRPHSAADEAVIGVGLARTLDVAVRESLTLSGGTHESVGRVEIVGIFAAPGATDYQLAVSLVTARHLSGVPDETIQFVRAARLAADGDGQADGPDVVDVATGGPVVANESFKPRVTIRNHGLCERLSCNSRIQALRIKSNRRALQRTRTHYRGTEGWTSTTGDPDYNRRAASWRVKETETRLRGRAHSNDSYHMDSLS